MAAAGRRLQQRLPPGVSAADLDTAATAWRKRNAKVAAAQKAVIAQQEKQQRFSDWEMAFTTNYWMLVGSTLVVGMLCMAICVGLCCCNGCCRN